MKWTRKETGKVTRSLAALLLAALCIALTGCMTGRESCRTASVMQYLYPDKKEHVETPSIPELTLPLRVGIAFVPGEQNDWKQKLSEQEKMALMKKIAGQFQQYPFIKGIELIPTMYLKPAGSFPNLDQIRRMYGIDVIVLLSYDQVRRTDEDLRSIGYWTLVGLYVVRGELNETSTMLDAAVFDIASRKLLFRAPGMSMVKATATPVNQSEQLRKNGNQGLEQAEAELIVNLKKELEEFKVKVKDSPQDYRIQRKPGYTGGGSLGELYLGIVALAGMVALPRKGNGRKG
ncbi:MAG TPA: rhombotarget lipoprotein [Geomonas sp.]|nr:rhombotarget lipoprotein [Geomonas sp.]